MESGLEGLEETPGDLRRHGVDSSKDRSAEFHSPFDNSCPIITDYPLHSFAGRDLGFCSRRIKKSKFVEAVSYLCILGIRDRIQLAEVEYVARWQSRIRLKAFQENHYSAISGNKYLTWGNRVPF